MAEYIERGKVVDLIQQIVAEIDDANEGMYSENFVSGYQAGLELAELRVNDIPAADVRPERHGEWLHCDDGLCECSECGTVAGDNFYKFCPNCGAKMDGKR